MAIIGEFTKDNGTLRGYVQTLDVNIGVHLKEVHQQRDSNIPNYAVIASNGATLGSARIKTGQRSGKDYLRVTMDDPSFPKAIHANLVEKDGKYLLMHSRVQQKAKSQNKNHDLER